MSANFEQWMKVAERNGEQQDALLLRFLLWRAKFHDIGVDNITEDMIINELKKGKSFTRGFDKQGRPVNYILVRLHKASESSPEELQKMTVWMFEQGRKLVKPPVETTTLVFDMRGYSMENMDYGFTRFLFEVFAFRYPESLGVALVVEAPFIFWAVWKMLSPLIDPKTVTKIHFVKAAQLLEYIHEDQLLAQYGGKDNFVYTYPFPEDSFYFQCTTQQQNHMTLVKEELVAVQVTQSGTTTVLIETKEELRKSEDNTDVSQSKGDRTSINQSGDS